MASSPPGRTPDRHTAQAVHRPASSTNSAALRNSDSDLESAAPGSRWTGSAATSYDAANAEHRRVIRQLAGLDQRLATEVTNSALVVDAGRRNLDAVRQWVVDAAASVPPGQAGEQMKMAIAQKGLTQLQEIIQKSNAESNAIGGRYRGLEGEYQTLGNQKFAKEGVGDALGATDDEKDKEEEAEKQAREDVKDPQGRRPTGRCTRRQSPRGHRAGPGPVRRAEGLPG